MPASMSAVSASCLLVALAVSLGSTVATAASGDRYPKPHRVHHAPPLYATYGWPRPAHPASLPYGPEYGFLRRVPPNATGTPG